jgi:hypothetical protein
MTEAQDLIDLLHNYNETNDRVLHVARHEGSGKSRLQSQPMRLALAVQPSFLWPVFLSLLVIFGASLAMFSLLVRRWTTHRRWVSLSEWAGERGMRIAKRALTDLPPPIDQLKQFGENPRVRLRVDGGRRHEGTVVLQFETGALDQPDFTSDKPTAPNPCWNVLIRRVPDGRPRVPAGLRPAHAGGSVIDFFRLTRFNSLSNERFGVLAIDGRTANRLAKTSARALLPQDVGLLLYGEHVVLDFSARPFDPTELDRLLAVADQVSGIV